MAATITRIALGEGSEDHLLSGRYGAELHRFHRAPDSRMGIEARKLVHESQFALRIQQPFDEVSHRRERHGVTALKEGGHMPRDM